LQWLEQNVPSVALQLARRAPADTRVLVGTLELGVQDFHAALPLDPGSYDVTVSAPGHRARTQRLELAPGDRRRLVVEPGPPLEVLPVHAVLPGPVAAEAAQQSAALGTAEQRDSGSSLGGRNMGLALLGLGAASLIGSGITAALALDRLAVVDAQCDRSTRQCKTQRGLDAARSGQTFYVASLVTLGVAVLSAGAGTYLLFSNPRVAGAELTLQPVLAPRSARLQASARF
jgi:hypothetical protein